ncbi:hypothetical protein ATN84_11035 [Paramesorhizobium deserti]|uniref:Uncharacterized protein n=1 Tax=Paramesorhizobium deserti TaxID=1494590 RepID=A0A135HTR3_9HYPH|nr:hypothetical protein [Paramesorhizobium deserti]KXF76587.1 hypothetical protein ATN84_11035 [Paramesorhizobium deserti]
MPIRGGYPGPESAYTSEDWRIMQAAYHKSAALLGQADGSKDTDRLAREIMRLYNLGYRDIEALAFAAANIENNRREQDKRSPASV